MLEGPELVVAGWWLRGAGGAVEHGPHTGPVLAVAIAEEERRSACETLLEQVLASGAPSGGGELFVVWDGNAGPLVL